MVGRCSCGDVELQLLAPTLFASHCHCRSCRTAHAAPFVTWTAVPTEALTVSGASSVSWFESSPGVQRGFCGRCGTQLLYRAQDAADRVYVPVAVLDRLDRPVEGHVSYEEHVPWLEGHEDLPCYAAKTSARLPWA
jgi:hypothetical protein